MASLDRELTAGPNAAAGGTLEPVHPAVPADEAGRPAGASARLVRRQIGLNLALLVAGCAAFAVVGDSWWQMVTAAYLAVVFTQLAFVGHDAGHRQLFRSRRAAAPFAR